MARYSDEILQKVGEINILDYAHSIGYELSRKGSSFKIPGFGGISIDLEGKQWKCFSDDSKDAKGGIIQFVMYMEKIDFRKAVEKLIEFGNVPHDFTDEFKKLKNESKNVVRTDQSFSLPNKADNYRRLYAYLMKTRKIDKEIIDYYVRHHKIYEDERHNVVFCGGDKDGNIKSASVRGTLDKPGRTAFKGMVANSDKNFPFSFQGKTDRLLIFEAPIDLLSYQSLQKLNATTQQCKDHYIALNGVAHIGLTSYLKEHPEIHRVLFCLDNDHAGIQSIINLTEVIEKNKQITAIDCKLPRAKDWNEDLINYHAEIEKQIGYEMEM